MTTVHVLTNGFNSPNAFAFLMPFIIHSKWLSDLGIKIKFFSEDTGKNLDDCDVLIFESKFLDPPNDTDFHFLVVRTFQTSTLWKPRDQQSEKRKKIKTLLLARGVLSQINY